MGGDLFDWARTRRPARSEPSGPVWTVSELTLRMKEHLEPEFADVWVEGEVSAARPSNSGHLYFQLKDSGAVASAVIWASQRRRLSVEPREGDKVVCRGHIDLYAPQGGYKLIVREVISKGLGALLAQKQALQEKLAAEGLLDADRKRPLPLLPRAVGLITSPDGAAVRDFLHIAVRRFPRARVLLVPASVQGERAPHEICRALSELRRWSTIDVVVLTRGGGSVEDLWCFNAESVARAIAGHPVPVVTAIGHERDVSIADLVADAMCPTPTAAAEQVFPNEQELRDGLDRQRARLETSLSRVTDRARNDIELAGERLERLVHGTVRVRRKELEDLGRRVRAHDPQTKLRAHHKELVQLRRRLRETGAALGRPPRSRLDDLRRRLRAGGEGIADRRGQLVRELGLRLEALSPLNVLERGYAIARTPEGHVLTNADQIAAGQPLHVLLRTGSLEATVDNVHAGARADDTEPGEKR